MATERWRAAYLLTVSILTVSTLAGCSVRRAAIPSGVPEPVAMPKREATREPRVPEPVEAQQAKPAVPLPIPARLLQVQAECSYRDDVGVEGSLGIVVKKSRIEHFVSRVDMGRRGSCEFDLRDFRQVRFDHTPTLVAGGCTVRLWEQGDEVTVAYRDCAAHCTASAHDYLWPTLIARSAGTCR